MSNEKFDEIKDYYEDLYNDKKGESFPFDYKRNEVFIKDIKPISEGISKSLDIGCGVGYACKMLKAKGFEVHGIDISQSALEQAEKNLPEGSFKLANESGKIEYEDNFFDTVICLGVLEHITNPEDVVREAYRVLKPGGSALFLVPNSLSPYFFFGKGTGQIMEVPRKLAVWKKMFESEGFKTVSVSKDKGPTIFKRFSIIKKMKIMLHKILNILPVSYTYQFIYKLEKAK